MLVQAEVMIVVIAGISFSVIAAVWWAVRIITQHLGDLYELQNDQATLVAEYLADIRAALLREEAEREEEDLIRA